jgi:hypothetical protein
VNPPLASRWSPEISALVKTILEACTAAKAACSARAVFCFSESFVYPLVEGQQGFNYLRAAGPRAFVMFSFEQEPAWFWRVTHLNLQQPTAAVEKGRAGRGMAWQPPEVPPDEVAANTIPSLALYLEALLEVFVGQHPADAEAYPVLSEGALERLTG